MKFLKTSFSLSSLLAASNNLKFFFVFFKDIENIIIKPAFSLRILDSQFFANPTTCTSDNNHRVSLKKSIKQ